MSNAYQAKRKPDLALDQRCDELLLDFDDTMAVSAELRKRSKVLIERSALLRAAVLREG